MDAREPDMCRVAGRLCRALTDGDARSLGVLTRSFPPGLLAPSPPDQVCVLLRAMARVVFACFLRKIFIYTHHAVRPPCLANEVFFLHVLLLLL